MPREPTDRRKSSFGAQRGPPRQHIPFRADDPTRGKKTGILVRYVDRNSDEIEPFDKVIKQADDHLPPRIKSIKKRVSVAPPVEFVDEYGEMSMESAESNQGSLLAYFTNANHVYALRSRKVFFAWPTIRPLSKLLVGCAPGCNYSSAQIIPETTTTTQSAQTSGRKLVT